MIIYRNGWICKSKDANIFIQVSNIRNFSFNLEDWEINIDNVADYNIDENTLNKLFNRIDRFKCGVKGEESFIKLSKIVVPYLIFIAEKPLHPVGNMNQP